MLIDGVVLIPRKYELLFYGHWEDDPICFQKLKPCPFCGGKQNIGLGSIITLVHMVTRAMIRSGMVYTALSVE